MDRMEHKVGDPVEIIVLKELFRKNGFNINNEVHHYVYVGVLGQMSEIIMNNGNITEFYDSIDNALKDLKGIEGRLKEAQTLVKSL